jgi:hypothetical protein
MKPIPTSTGALASYLAATLLFSTIPSRAQTLVNGNFDAQTNFTVFPGYASGNGGAITGWTLSNSARIGLNNTTGPFWSSPCGPIPSAPNCAFIQASGGPASISQTVTGLTIGTKYVVTARISARSGNTPSLVFSTDGNGPTVKLEVTAPPSAGSLATATVFRTAAFHFTATATSHLIAFTNDRASGDHTLLLDDVTVAPAAASSSWAIAPWTGDADSGVDPQYVYTHAHHFHAPGGTFNATTWQPVKINGVDFDLGDTPGSNRFTRTNLTANFTNRTPNNVTGESAKLAKDFLYDGPNTGITLQNLKPNTQYVFTFYGLGFDAAGSYRSATFNSNVPGSDQFSANLNHYGQGNGIRVNYTYTTDASATPVTISYPTHGAGTFHTAGFSNREAVASTPPVVWTAHPWADDETSGISPNHVYTHAISFGSASNVHVNGVNFTGVAGINPTATNYTSSNLPGVSNNDVNSVTGYSSGLAKDFIFGGFPETHNLSGLTPGKKYVFTLYTVGWNDGTRRVALIGGTGEGATVLNQDALGDNQGQRFEYEYTANAAGTATITAAGLDAATSGAFDRKSFHTYAISNREADPMVGVAPTITLQPTGANIGVGSDYTLRGGATGSATLTYQWKRGTTDIPGATSPVLLLEDVDSTAAGSYTLVVTNGVSSTTSNAAVVNVLENVPGVFSTGVNNLGQALAAGATDPHYTLVTNPDNIGTTTALVQNPIPGSWAPHSATATWIGPRNFTAAANGTADAGEGAGTYVYRTQIDLTGFDLSTVQISGSWVSDNSGLALRVNGAATGITNSTGNTFGVLSPFTINLTNAPGLIAGINNIDFVINNAGDGYTGLRVVDLHAIGAIPPNTPPHIAVQPQGGTGLHDGTFTLSVGASGSAPLAYQWYKGANPIPGEQAATLDVAIDSLTAGGDFKVRVSNGVTFVDSSVATISVTNATPVVVDDDATTNEGTPVQIDVALEMLDNDTDADGDGLTLAGFSPTSFNGGTVTQNLGVLTYTPAPGFDGLDGFTYTVTDGWGGTSTTATVLITVNNVANPAPGPMTLSVNLSGSNVTGTFTGAPGATYILQRSTTLAAGSWVDVDTKVAPGSGTVTVTDNSPPAGRAFYRISYTP